MRNTEHPAYHHTTRKFARLVSLLQNFESVLREDGFACETELQWAGRELTRLSDLQEAAEKDAAQLPAWRAEEERLEPELFQRMDQLLAFLKAHAPEHPWLPPYLLYFARWRECRGEPIRPLTAEDLKPLEEAEEIVVAPTVYGVPFERLDAVRLRLGELDVDNKIIAPTIMFLCGLFHATSYHDRYERLPAHEFDDGLADAAREALESAIDFAQEPGTVARAEKTELLPKAHLQLFMGIGHASIAHTPAVYEWLHRYSFTHGITSLLFAMGVRALTDPYARALLADWQVDAEGALALLPEGCHDLIASFATGEF